ncbi:MAG: hypothetical protein EXR75_01730 [Myxococcales bacterium]|nr:hypothetical protein [Myxococcales bacterium]
MGRSDAEIAAENARGEAADPVEVADADRRLEELLGQISVARTDEVSEARTAAPQVPLGLAGVAMRTAVPLSVAGRTVRLAVRGLSAEVDGELGLGVSAELVREAARNRDAVVLECVPDGPPIVVGVLQTRIPDELIIRAGKVKIEADEELLLRSGRGAIRLKADGDIELVGSRISAMSRGLFRIVGRMLRLN